MLKESQEDVGLMYESSIFNLKIDFGKSRGSYIYDKNKKRFFLDFFGLYASLPLGYNSPIFREKTYLKDYQKTAAIKVANCEIISDEGREFFRAFKSQPGRNYQYFWFCCTGGLAVEAAIKTAMAYKQSQLPIVISLKESFHGISGYSCSTTDSFWPISNRLEGLPRFPWPKLYNPKISTGPKGLAKFESEFKAVIRKNKGNIVALLVEPIQATFGDNHFPKEFFKLARKLCNQENIVLIFDEIQTGFGTTGKMWYWQHIGIEPDIVVFGKKAQVSGIMVKQKFGKIFENPDRLSVTFDGDLSDMVRCRQILKAYRKYNLLQNATERGKELKAKLEQIPQLKSVRGQGLLLAFDFDTHEQQLGFAKRAFKNGLIFNRTRELTIRLRPNLNVTKDEVNKAIDIIKSSV